MRIIQNTNYTTAVSLHMSRIIAKYGKLVLPPHQLRETTKINKNTLKQFLKMAKN